MDMTTIQSLRDRVVYAYAMGHITNAGVEAGLLQLVDAAQAAADRAKAQTAINNLRAFIALVQAQSGISIQTMCADCLTMHAGMVIDALRAKT
jgi:hypothetical protein